MAVDAQGCWKPDLFPKQQELLEACLPQEQNLVLANGPRKSSKCVSPDTLVYCENGPVPIGSLGKSGEGLFSNISQRVVSMSPEGTDLIVSEAKQFYNSGVKSANSVKTKRGYEITCSKNHPIWSECDGEIGYRTSEEIRGIVESGKEVWLPLVREHPLSWKSECKEVEFDWFSGQEHNSKLASDRIKMAVSMGAKTITQIMKISKSCNSTVHKWWKTPMRPKRIHLTIDDDIGYLLGLFVGDGCYTPTIMANFRVGFSSLDKEIIDFLKNTLESRFPETFFEFESRCDYNIRSAAFRHFLKYLGMSGKYAHEKTVPDIIFQSPQSVIVSFLQGLFDTDGTVDKRKGAASYCTTSMALGKGVQNLLLALGVRSSRHFHANDFRGAWIITPMQEDRFLDKVGFRLARKQALLTPRPGKYTKKYSSYPPSLIQILKDLHRTRKERGIGTLPRMTHKHIINAVFRGNVSLSRKRIDPLLKVINAENDPRLNPYLMNGKVWWDKVDSCERTECLLVDLSVPGPSNFIGNGFINHNTWACAHAVCQHAWNTDRGNICILTFTQSVGIDSGVWKHLTQRFLPEWIGNKETGAGGNFGMEWVDEPYIQNVTKKPACSVSNAHGNVTEISLESLKNEKEAEERFKGREYSMIWVNELTKFSLRSTFDTLKQALRAPHLRDDQLLLLADTNPCLIYGKQSVWYKIWYDFRTMTDEQVIEYAVELCGPDSEIEPTDMIPERDALKLIEFTVDDNLWLTEKQKARLRASFAHDPDLYAAYYLGQWVTASRDALFHDVFKHNLHVFGEVSTPNNKEPEILVPQPECYELCSGWDPGGRNCAAVIAEKVMWKYKFITTEGNKEKEVEKELPIFKFLDELISVDEDFKMEDFVEQFVRKMAFWENYILTQGNGVGKVRWRHWSDRNVFDTKLPFTDRFWVEHIYDCSGGNITLMAERGNRGSVQARVDLWRKLLFEDRLLFSAEKTPHLIQMCKSIKKGTTSSGKPTVAAIARGSYWKHSFDSGSYLISSEAMDELQRSIRINVKRRTDNQLIHVPL